MWFLNALILGANVAANKFKQVLFGERIHLKVKLYFVI